MVKSNSPSGRTSNSSTIPTKARSMGTNFTSGSASEASRLRTITHRSPNPASTTSAATWRRPVGSSFLLSGCTINNFNPSVSGYLMVQTAVPSTRPNNMGLFHPCTGQHALDDGFNKLIIQLIPQASVNGCDNPVVQIVGTGCGCGRGL